MKFTNTSIMIAAIGTAAVAIGLAIALLFPDLKRARKND